jgi:hypothetical protein
MSSKQVHVIKKASTCKCFSCARSLRPIHQVSRPWADGYQEHHANAIAARIIRRAAMVGVTMKPADAKAAAGNLVGSQGTDHIGGRCAGIARTVADIKAALEWSTKRWAFFGYGPVYGIWPGEATFWGGSRLWSDWNAARQARLSA